MCRGWHPSALAHVHENRKLLDVATDPDVERLAPFFTQRYRNIRWSLFTPQRTLHWDGRTITLAPGAPSSELPPEESHAGAEELWRKYFMSGNALRAGTT